MVKYVFWLIAAVILTALYVLYAVIFVRTEEYKKCIPSKEGIKDQNDMEKFTYSFLELAKTDLRTMSDYERNITCQYSRGNWSELIKKAKINWANCVTDELGDFVSDMLGTFLDFFCFPGNAEGVFGTESLQCRRQIEAARDQFRRCPLKVSRPSKHFPTKVEICDDVNLAQKCFTEMLDLNCPSYYDGKRLKDIFFDYMARPCSSCSHFISSFAILSSVLLHFFINKF